MGRVTSAAVVDDVEIRELDWRIEELLLLLAELGGLDAGVAEAEAPGLGAPPAGATKTTER
jgi:hypothetical protein